MTINYSATVHSAPQKARDRMEAIFKKAADSTGISLAAMMLLMESPASDLIERLFAAARRQRDLHFGNSVFLYGFLYISTYCRNQCRFCFYRRTNSRAIRYRKTMAEITKSSRLLAQSGVHLIDLTAGEDPSFITDGYNGFASVIDIVKSIKADIGLPMMASVGVVPDSVLDKLVAAGVDWYACYQETYNRHLFDKLRVGQSFQARYQTKMAAKAKGMLVEEGLLCSVGETSHDLINSLDAMSQISPDQVRVMTFVPQTGTPMYDYSPSSSLREIVAIALMRIAYPELLIPASLDVDGLAGLKMRLDAGANVITSLVPPGQGLAGVAQSELDIEEGRRTLEGIASILRNCGLQAATTDHYLKWIAERKRKNSIHKHRGITAR